MIATGTRRLAAAALLAGLAAAPGCGGGARELRPEPAPGAAGWPGARWGVEVRPPRRLAAGYVVEVRLRVLDAERAAPLFDPAAPARLIGEAGGQLLAPAGPGPALAGARPEAGREVAVRFDNTRNAVAAGARATFILGPLEERGLVVEE